ncbi:MAG: ornithine carbamoyltransferase [Planctomycetota bacterium]
MNPADHFVSLTSWPASRIRSLLELAAELKQKQHQGTPHACLQGKSVALYFEKPSTRTRISFEVACAQLGGTGLYIDMRGKRLGEREAIKDVARVMSRYVDGIMARVYAHESVLELAEHSSVPVINGLSDYAHPCQGLADWQTVIEQVGRDRELTVAYIGDGNNVARSLAVMALKLGARLVVAAPEGYQLDMSFTKNFADDEPTPGEVELTDDPHHAVAGADIVYTDVWASMGQEEESARRERDFASFQVNEKLMAAAPDHAKFMHCLPAHRGLEVTDGVIDSPASVVYDQAENRLHTAKAVLVKLIGLSS